MKICGQLCLFALVAESLLAKVRRTQPARGKGDREDDIQNIIYRKIQKMWYLSREFIDATNLQRFWPRPSLFGGDKWSQAPSFLFAEKYNCMWAYSDIFRESAHD